MNDKDSLKNKFTFSVIKAPRLTRRKNIGISGYFEFLQRRRTVPENVKLFLSEL